MRHTHASLIHAHYTMLYTQLYMYAYMLFAAIFLSTESNSRELYWIEEKNTPEIISCLFGFGPKMRIYQHEN